MIFTHADNPPRPDVFSMDEYRKLYREGKRDCQRLRNRERKRRGI